MAMIPEDQSMRSGLGLTAPMSVVPGCRSGLIRRLVVPALLGLLLPAAVAFEELPADYDTSALDEDQLEDIKALISTSWYHLAELQELIDRQDLIEIDPKEWGEVTQTMLQEITQKQDFIFEAGEEDSWGPPRGLEDWWKDGMALWQWLDTEGQLAYDAYWEVGTDIWVVQKNSMPSLKEFKSRYHTTAAGIEDHLKQAWKHSKAGRTTKVNEVLIKLEFDLHSADMLEGLALSNLEDLLDWETYAAASRASKSPAELYGSWQITSSDHPIFGPFREGWIADSEALWTSHEAAYRRLVEALNPLRSDSLLQSKKDYEYMWGWNKAEIRSRLNAEVKKIIED